MKEIKARFEPELSDLFEAATNPIRVVGLYADTQGFVAATHRLHRMATRRAAGCRIDSTWWSFKSLGETQERETAAQAAAEADSIWCSACLCEPLPDAVKAWLDVWLARKPRMDASFMALLRCPLALDFEQSPTRLCLRLAADAAQMEFFERCLNCTCRERDILPGAATDGFGHSPSWISGPEDRAISEWGLNEY